MTKQLGRGCSTLYLLEHAIKLLSWLANAVGLGSFGGTLLALRIFLRYGAKRVEVMIVWEGMKFNSGKVNLESVEKSE